MTQPGKLADALTPAKVVLTLDRFIVGQDKAKRAVAIALRNRIRRRWLAADLSEEIAPKNILMVGPTGVGKTEIARRLASLVDSPFIKVEATKFTEVGYVGRDVESMIRDLAESAGPTRKRLLLPPSPLRERETVSGRCSSEENWTTGRSRSRYRNSLNLVFPWQEAAWREWRLTSGKSLGD